MQYIDIKFALAKKGYTLTRVAKELGLSDCAVIQQVCSRKYISGRVESKVAQITGIPLHRLFPDRYNRPPKPPADASVPPPPEAA